MSKFIQNGDVFSPTPGRDSVLDTLPPGNFIVIETMQGLMFKKVDPFGAPGRMYGKITSRADRIMSTFLDRPRTTGVLLSGEKGSGKSQLARNISYAGYEKNIPTILVNAPLFGDAFNNLLASIEQPAIVLMDEFEKVYAHEEHQEQVLTLLDGVMTSKKLFVLTVNDKWRVNSHMKNRPGRIFYSIEFDGLETEFVREYCEDNLKDKAEIENILKVAMMFTAFNFDMLKALVEEMNRYDEGAFDSLELLNAKPMSTSPTTTYEAIAVSPKGIRSKITENNTLPMGANDREAIGIWFDFETPVDGGESDIAMFAREIGIEPDEDDNATLRRHFRINATDLKKVDVDSETYEFEVDDFRITLRRKLQSAYDLRSVTY